VEEIVQAPTWDQTWQVITTSLPSQWQFTTWLALLYYWQTLAAGVFALGAAWLAVRAAHQRERREVEAIRLSLAVEIRHLVNILLQTHDGFGQSLRKNQCLRADDVLKQTSRGVPVVYPATADRVGLLGSVAPDVVIFYANLQDLNFAGRMTSSDPAEPVPSDALSGLMKLIKKACQSALPLLSELPPNTADPDTERKAKIEAM
jgi:hypothetical protein